MILGFAKLNNLCTRTLKDEGESKDPERGEGAVCVEHPLLSASRDPGNPARMGARGGGLRYESL
jgi:hypothetical protein